MGMNNMWTVTVEEDENGELILPFPDDMMSDAEWLEGDELDFEMEGNDIVITNLSWLARQCGKCSL